jgi:hypothetical protein
LKVIFTEDLLRLAEPFIPSVKKYRSSIRVINNERTKFERTVDAVLSDFTKMPQDARHKINALLLDSTMKKLWAFQPKWDGWKGGTITVDPEMARRFRELPSDAARESVVAVLRHGDQTRHALQEAILANIDTEYDAEIKMAEARGDTTQAAVLKRKKASQIRMFEAVLDMNGTWPYAPLKRFGKYVVVGVSQAYRAAKDAYKRL